MKPEDETPKAQDDEASATPEDEAPPASQPEASPPPPATWAGRRRAGGEEPEVPPEEETVPPAEDQEADPEQLEAEAEAEELEAKAETEGAHEKPEVGEPSDEMDPDPALGDTVEAETLTLADREQAQEAALAGLRARTGQHAAAPVPEPDADGDHGEEQEAEAEAEPDPAAVAAATAVDGDQDGGKRPRAKRVWPRFLAATFLIISSMAAATAVSLLVVLTNVAGGFGGIAGVSERLDAVEGGDPQTILILGSDKRPDEDRGRSDTTILLRVDPDRDALNLLSIPRDLKVPIPTYGTGKFNTAYSVGGPPLTLRTLQQLTGLEINHVVNINFTGFADAVDAIGCVFIDVDRRYFVPEESLYSAIDPPIEPGYQKLCGLKALQYVRFRLDDTDLVRAARQQDFVREARQKISPARMAFEPDYRNELLDVFKEYTTSDDRLKDPIEVLEVMKTFIGARQASLNEVHFPADLGDGSSGYVTATNEAIGNAVDEFLGTGGTPGPQVPGDDAPAREPRDDDKPDKPKPDRPKPASEPDGPAMVDVTGTAQDYARQIASAERNNGKPFVRFPIFYPTRLTEGSTIDSTSRGFIIDGPTKYFGYKFVVPFQPINTAFSEYYGVSGTNWDDPPILENPSETREIDGREYMLFYDGDRLRLVGFKRNGSSYWVINSLLQTLSEAEMISIATSMRERDG